jgi:hypothetical protein
VNDAPRNEIVLGVEHNEDQAPIRFAFESCERLSAKLTVARAPLSVGAGYVVQGLLSHSATPVAVIPIP